MACHVRFKTNPNELIQKTRCFTMTLPSLRQLSHSNSPTPHTCSKPMTSTPISSSISKQTVAKTTSTQAPKLTNFLTEKEKERTLFLHAVNRFCCLVLCCTSDSISGIRSAAQQQKFHVQISECACVWQVGASIQWSCCLRSRTRRRGPV
jgi:hypothetical protein